jgi:hypothetical protein
LVRLRHHDIDERYLDGILPYPEQNKHDEVFRPYIVALPKLL